jgi:hypothetical protein
MNITITADKTLKKISEEFSQKFPNLKLEFYSAPHQVGEKSSLWDKLNLDQPISKVGNFGHDETLSINGHIKVANLEQQFQKLYGIGMQVMRRRGPNWVQTSASDDWTLAQQNREGEAIS